MLIKLGAVRGAAVGLALAVIMISLDNLNLGRISIPLSSFIDRAIFKVCPLYILGFSNFVTNKPVWFLVTILGNVFIYGLLGVLIAAGMSLFRKVHV
jgi:hypothetical protein